jgi:hypothetical protein
MSFSKKLIALSLAGLLFSSCALATQEEKALPAIPAAQLSPAPVAPAQSGFSKPVAIAISATIALPLAYYLSQSSSTQLEQASYFIILALAGTWSFSKTLAL